MQENKSIGEYINKYSNFDEIFKIDERLNVASALSPISRGLFAWYPFDKTGDLLQIGSSFGELTELFLNRCKNVTVVEPYHYRTDLTQKRLSGYKNICIYNLSFYEYILKFKKKYKYIVCVVDEACNFLRNQNEYIKFVTAVKSLLTYDGKFLFVVPNRLGIKYLCGYTDNNFDKPFYGITDNNSKVYRFERTELLNLFDKIGFKYTKIYYPLADYKFTQFIYTDDKIPSKEFSERSYMYYTDKKDTYHLDESQMADYFARNEVLHIFSNSFLIETSNTLNSDIIYAAITSNRNKEQAFATVIHSSNKVEKIPLYDEGNLGLQNLIVNHENLAKYNIPVLKLSKTPVGIEMEKVNFPSLLEHLKTLKNKQDIINFFDMLWNYILKSSSHVSKEKNFLYTLAPNADWGIILQNAYLEMIPANCFYTNDDLLFFDQEYILKNCPAKLVLYRAIEDMYSFYSQAENIINKQELKDRYNLNEVWKYLKQVVDKFHDDLGGINLFKGLKYWSWQMFSVLKNNRRCLSVDNKLNGSFDVRTNLEGQRIILFGSGKFADCYLDTYEGVQKPEFIVDNNSEKWGTYKRGIEIKSPSELNKLMAGTFQVVVTIKDYQPVIEQLKRMGIGQNSYRIYNRWIESLVYNRLENTMVDGKYNIGYVTGVFDLFHIGHLNLLKRCKERCHYLIAGVLTDELTLAEKEKSPFIPFDERLEIVKACKYVDRVYVIDFHNTDKIVAWQELKYNCLFAGNDHANEQSWLDLQRVLRSLGSDLEFFPYTDSTNSSMLQKVISDYIKNED